MSHGNEIENAIAIVGMAGRFPGAKNLEEFWRNLCEGKDSLSHFSKQELRDAGLPEELLAHPRYVRARGVLEDVALFDAEFFGMPATEAQVTDPQHRLFLECASEALENAGYNPDLYAGAVGVYGGCGYSSYYLHNIYPNQKIKQALGEHLIRIGNEKDYLTTRVSYKLNLKGPSMAIQTACSTSLVAVSVACNHLLSYQCDMALAGGATVEVPQESGYIYQQDMIFSPDGVCRPFDAKGQGTVSGNGVGIVVLKRLEDALADRDHIYAIIRGYGMNNDGVTKVGFSAPSVQGQADAIISALAMSEVDPETISYVEAHGTATFLGDPIEISALNQAFGLHTQKKQFCAIGSVKGNIGHLFESAGIAGLIKTALSLHHEKIPPSIHFETPNPNIDFAQSPFFINTALQEWKRGASPRRAGVSSFGFGGTNAHVILEEAPIVQFDEVAQKEHLLVLSAKTPSALRTQSKNLAHYLKEHPDVSLADVAYTLRVGRRSFAQRRLLSCKNREDAIQQLLKESGDATVGAPQERLGRRISLPTYPFEKKRFWIDAPRETGVLEDVSNKKADSLKEIEQALLAIWKDFLGVESLSLDDDFFKLGGDSFLATQVVAKVQEQLAVSLRMQALIESPTVSQLAREIFNKLQAISKDAALPAILVKIRAGGSKAPLFFVHPIGGNVFCYKFLAECLKYDGPIFGIQAPLFAGIDAASLTSMEEIAAYYVKAIRSVQPKGAYHLLGASFGGAVAYEMARQLKEGGLPVTLLAMIDIGNPEALFEKAESDLEMLALLIELFEAKAVALESLKVLSPEDQIKRLMRSMGLEEMSLSLQKQVFEQVKGSWRALMHYHPKPYAGKILFFQAQERFFRHKEMSLGESWRNLAKGGVAIHEVAGNHLNMIMLPGVADLQSALDSYLQMEALS